MNRILMISYACSVVEPILLSIIHIRNKTDASDILAYDNFSISYVYNISIQVFLTASAALYIPIVISISKVANLTSAKINKPQIFVALQLVIVAAKQMIFVILVLVFETFDVIPVEVTIEISQSVDPKYIPIFLAFFNSKAIDILLMPTITQIAYLGCVNMKNNGLHSKPTYKKFGAINVNRKRETGKIPKITFWPIHKMMLLL
ncbi:hypothetical protein B9Z55_021533 [Caenorhabditis nigoni]|uniref:Serpentine receptor class gamma n=1 Tax=Caenorhabditis nigoni TaxID=1611254 RepID=A0A2G5TSG7_9PELO|nr:hypothetical protein B9Z55_021533 [Caenorhabditis nigoni]